MGRRSSDRSGPVAAVHDDNPIPAAQVFLQTGFSPELPRLEQLLDRGPLIVAEFREKPSGLPKPIGAFSGEAAVKIEAVRTPVECEDRVVITDLGIEGRDIARGNVGWIGDDDIKRAAKGTGQGLKAIA